MRVIIRDASNTVKVSGGGGVGEMQGVGKRAEL